MAAIYGRCRAVRLLHFAAASWRAQLTFSLTLRMRRVVPAGEDPHHGQDHQPEDERPDGSPLLAPGLPPDSGAEHDQDQDDAHALIVAAAAGACKPCRARERFQAVPKLIDAAKAEPGCQVLPTRMPRVCRVFVSLFDYMPQRCPFGHEPCLASHRSGRNPAVVKPGPATETLRHRRQVPPAAEPDEWLPESRLVG